jgi:hypothetical protein
VVTGQGDLHRHLTAREHLPVVQKEPTKIEAARDEQRKGKPDQAEHELPASVRHFIREVRIRAKFELLHQRFQNRVRESCESAL